jgi:hypothetical protein
MPASLWLGVVSPCSKLQDELTWLRREAGPLSLCAWASAPALCMTCWLAYHLPDQRRKQGVSQRSSRVPWQTSAEP